MDPRKGLFKFDGGDPLPELEIDGLAPDKIELIRTKFTQPGKARFRDFSRVGQIFEGDHVNWHRESTQDLGLVTFDIDLDEFWPPVNGDQLV